MDYFANVLNISIYFEPHFLHIAPLSKSMEVSIFEVLKVKVVILQNSPNPNVMYEIHR